MKTLLFTIEYPPFNGGVANYYGNLVSNWPDKDDIIVLDNNKSKLISSFFFPKWIPAFSKLWKAIKKNQINHVIVGHILPLGTVAYFLSKIIKFEYTVIIHGMDIAYARKRWRKKRISSKILLKAKNIITCNNYTADFIKNNFNEKIYEKVKVVNPGINRNIQINQNKVQEIKNKYRIENQIIMFSISRLVKRKGIDNLIAAMPEVTKYIPNLQYFIGGNGPDKEYLFQKAKGVKNVFFLGELSEEEKWAWFDICDIFAMPSRNIKGDFEGFGIVYLEAGILGKPVIAGDSGGIRDAVIGAKTGILVDPENIDQIASAIIKLAKDKTLRENMGKASKERIIADFSWNIQIKKIYNIIKE